MCPTPLSSRYPLPLKVHGQEIFIFWFFINLLPFCPWILGLCHFWVCSTICWDIWLNLKVFRCHWHRQKSLEPNRFFYRFEWHRQIFLTSKAGTPATAGKPATVGTPATAWLPATARTQATTGTPSTGEKPAVIGRHFWPVYNKHFASPFKGRTSWNPSCVCGMHHNMVLSK